MNEEGLTDSSNLRLFFLERRHTLNHVLQLKSYYLRPVGWPLKHLCHSPGVIPVPVRAKLCQNEGMHPTKSSSTPAPKYSKI
jgi:hypothetical protein